ncbi:methenyltetrahydromethanopterin cyclohydrolase [Ideonella sp. DXS29W]|uniref:Methenyltetrahydromethanopterin cyclohydrolase n=1 Tax=Ideonella lacteola TaxID=2984193 RepID=A0ABU9BKT2_9BURK
MTDPNPALAGCRISVNAGAGPLVKRLLDEADTLGVSSSLHHGGVCIVDAGVAARGSVAAGLIVGEICLGGLGSVALRGEGASGPSGWPSWPSWVDVHSAQPVLACLGSQYAGWSLAASKEETGGKKFFALGSGPARALAGKEALFGELGYRDASATGVLVLEVDRVPPPVILDKLLRHCGLQPAGLTVILTPTTSLAGTTQVVARVLEVALHKAHELGFALGDIVGGRGTAPLPSPSPDGVQAMGRTNDAILYGGRVHLTVKGGDDAARALAQRLPSCHSRDYGRSFAEIFREAEYDFYKIDGALFAPAEVWVSNLDSGRTWHGGATDMALLQSLWMEAA